MDDYLKMCTLNAEQRWYIINEWKNHLTSISKIPRYIHCHISTVYRVIDYYCFHHNVNYGHDIDRLSAFDSKQIKKLDRAVQNNRSATAIESKGKKQILLDPTIQKNPKNSIGF